MTFRISKGYDQVTKTIRISAPLAEELERLAAENDISLNKLINQCIRFALENQGENESGDDELCLEMT